MKNLYDIKMNHEMVRNIEQGLTHYNKYRKTREERLFSNAGDQCSLHESLSRQSKTELDHIRRTYGFSKMSALKKADLVDELNKMIPAAVKLIFETLDRNRYDMLMRIIRQNGVIEYSSLSGKEREEYRKFGVLFHGISEGKKILFIPKDLLGILRKLNKREVEEVIERNTEWILLTQGLLYFIGIMEIPHLRHKVSTYSSFHMDIASYNETIISAARYYGEIHIKIFQYQHKNVREPDRIEDEQRHLATLGDFPFSKEQLLRAGVPNYVEKSPFMKDLLRLLQEEYIISSRELNEIADQIIELINMTGSSKLIMKYLARIFDFPSTDFAYLIDLLVVELCNNTRLWVLKGFTLNEMEIQNKRLDNESSSVRMETPLVSMEGSIVKTDRIGRHEKCPCGSGTKSKKCCR